MPATPLSFLHVFPALSPPPCISIHAGHAISREGAVSWTNKIITVSPSLPFSGQLGKPPPYLEGGVYRTPPHDLITGSRGAGMASGCMAPECTLGKGAAQKCAVWHDVAAGEWGADFLSRALVETGGISGSQARQAPPLGLRRPQRGQKQKGN